jgi:chemotaxis protein methyltransferase CheR
MNLDDFKFYQQLLIDHSGLSLTQDKTYLLNTRLDPVARSMEFATLDEFTNNLRTNLDPRTISLIVQAMATKETSFFRDSMPFIHLKNNILPALVKKNAATKTIRIWSAACSTGQEPYSIAMVAREFLQAHPGWAVQITATDIADDALMQAQEGLYSHFDIQRGLTMKLILDHFTMENTKWRVQDDLKQMIRFAKFNLMKPMESMGRFDVIFCRNVLIYFDTPTKKSVLDRLGERLQPDGYLLLGACESSIGLNTRLRLCSDMPGVHMAAIPVAGAQKENAK